MASQKTTEVDPTTQHQNWTTAASTYDDVIGKTTVHGTARLVTIAHDLHPFTSKHPVLDVGTGSGSLTSTIKRLFPSVPILAIDNAKGMLAKVENLSLPGVETRLADAETLSDHLPEAHFSHTLSSFVLQFIPEADSALQSMSKVTRPGGIVGVAIWGRSVAPFMLHLEACGSLNPEYVPAEAAPKSAWYDEEELGPALEKAGLLEVGTEKIEMPYEARDPESAVGYWFRMKNPVPRKMIEHWVDGGGDEGELEAEYDRLVRERFESGERMVCEAVLGWGRKAGG